MKNIFLAAIWSFVLFTNNIYAQSIRLDKKNIEAVHVYVSSEIQLGKEVIRVIKDSNVKEVDEPTFVKLKGIHFRNGSIEVKVMSRLLKVRRTLPEVLSVSPSVSTTAIRNMKVSISAPSTQEQMTRCDEIMPFNIILIPNTNLTA